MSTTTRVRRDYGAGRHPLTLDLFPERAQSRPGEAVGLRLLVDAAPGADVHVTVECLRMDDVVARCDVETRVNGDGTATLRVSLPAPVTTRPITGYALRAIARAGSESALATSAFDVASHWSRAPRYGFVSEFPPAESDAAARRVLDDALRLHLNVLQFYDWMPNHYELVSNDDEYVDAQERKLSRRTVERRIALCHERGIAALAYGALYGAEKAFAESHPDWLLYDGQRRPLHLANLYYLQDISRRSGWREWIIGQYTRVLGELGFDGIHIDQYGFPKEALSRAGGVWRLLDVGAEFPPFVEEASSRAKMVRPDGGCVFNCVNAWPLDAMAAVGSDAATYIEVWEPHVSYRDLYTLVCRARALRPAKRVILAAYLRPFHPTEERTSGALAAFRLAFAAIHASGGTQLIAGEGQSLLTEAYYPRHGGLSDGEFAVVRRYHDFVVRHADMLDVGGPDEAWTHVGPTNEVVLLESTPRSPYGAGAVLGSIWTILRRDGERRVLHLVNLRGLAHDRWNSSQTEPAIVDQIEIQLRSPGDVADVFWDSPDVEDGSVRRLQPERSTDEIVRISLPRLDTWALLTWRQRTSVDGDEAESRRGA